MAFKLKAVKSLLILSAGVLSLGSCMKYLESGWESYKGDEKSTSYAAFDQINLRNIQNLDKDWTFQMHDLEEGDEPVSSQANPIIVEGIL